MLNILVTGSKGQLGSELQRIAPQMKDAVFLFHDINTLNVTDQNEFKRFLENQAVQLIINCAAYTAVDRAESEPDNAYMVNHKAVEIINNASRNYQCRVIHISTDYVFDGTKNKPYNECDETNPESVYGKSKLKGEKALDPDNAIIIRTSWLYSTHGNNFVKTMLRLSSEREEVKVIYDQTGTPTFAGDLAQAILDIVSQISTGVFIPGIYHYSNEGVTSWYDFAKAIFCFKESDCRVVPIETFELPMPAKRPFYSVLNKRKIRETFGITIPYWRTSLQKCLEQI